MTDTAVKPGDVDTYVASRIIYRVNIRDSAAHSARLLGFSLKDVEQVVREPKKSRWDPNSLTLGHLVLHHSNGVLIAVAGYREPQVPLVLAVYDEDKYFQEPKERYRSTGHTTGTTLPTSLKALFRMIEDRGYHLTKDNHPKVLDRHGNLVYTLPGTPGDHRSLANAWKSFLKIHEKRQLNKKNN